VPPGQRAQRREKEGRVHRRCLCLQVGHVQGASLAAPVRRPAADPDAQIVTANRPGPLPDRAYEHERVRQDPQARAIGEEAELRSGQQLAGGFGGHPGASRSRRRLARPERCRQRGDENALRRHPLLDNPQPMPLTRMKTSPCPVQPRPAGWPELDGNLGAAGRAPQPRDGARRHQPGRRTGQVPGQVDGALTRFTPVEPERRNYIRHVCVRNADPQNDAVEALRHGHDCPSRCIRERETYTDVSRYASGTPLI
jgi:hypothetical protein